MSIKVYYEANTCYTVMMYFKSKHGSSKGKWVNERMKRQNALDTLVDLNKCCRSNGLNVGACHWNTSTEFSFTQTDDKLMIHNPLDDIRWHFTWFRWFFFSHFVSFVICRLSFVSLGFRCGKMRHITNSNAISVKMNQNRVHIRNEMVQLDYKFHWFIFHWQQTLTKRKIRFFRA